MARPNWYYDHPPACTCAQCRPTSRSHRRRGRNGSSKPSTLWGIVTVVALMGFGAFVVWGISVTGHWSDAGVRSPGAAAPQGANQSGNQAGFGSEGVGVPGGVSIKDSDDERRSFDSDRSSRNWGSTGRRRSGVGALFGALLGFGWWGFRAWLSRS